MFVCWSLKGGAGTSVFAAALALALAPQRRSLLVDLGGDQGPILGLAPSDAPGLTDWLRAGSDADALRRVERDVVDGCVLLPRGQGSLPPDGGRAGALAEVLAARSRSVVVDAGTVGGGEPWLIPLLERADQSWLVTRPCYLALRRVHECPIRPTGVVLIHEPGRALGRADVEAVVGAPVVADIGWDPAVARAVDAGLLGSRLPRSLRRALPQVAA